MSQFAPLSLAPGVTHQHTESAFNPNAFNSAPFVTNNVFSIDNAFPTYFAPGSPLEQHASPASSAGELFNQTSDRESSPASSFLPTPAGSPKMHHNDVHNQQWVSQLGIAIRSD